MRIIKRSETEALITFLLSHIISDKSEHRTYNILCEHYPLYKPSFSISNTIGRPTTIIHGPTQRMVYFLLTTDYVKNRCMCIRCNEASTCLRRSTPSVTCCKCMFIHYVCICVSDASLIEPIKVKSVDFSHPGNC